MAELYLFDLDDTLIDSSIYTRMHHELLERIQEKLMMTSQDLQGHIARLKEKKGKADSYELCLELKCTDLYYEVLEKYIRHTYSLKSHDIPAIFKKLKESKKKIGIISNSQLRTIKLFMERFSLMQYIDFIESGKKDTVLFWIELEKKHNLHKATTLVIDNSDEILGLAADAGYQTLKARDMARLKDML